MPNPLPTTRWGTQTIDVAGQAICVATRPGALGGPPLLLCNGLGVSLEVLEPFVRVLDGVTTTAFDVPGNGGSPPARQPLRMAGLARLVIALVDRLGYPTMDVLGVSWGGFLPRSSPTASRGACASSCWPPPRAGGLAIPGRFSTLASMVDPRRHRDPDHLVRLAGRLSGGAGRTHPEVARMYLGNSKPPSTPGYLGQLLALVGWTSIFWLPRLRQPTLVLAGRDDPLCPPANGRLLTGRTPGARLVLVDDGHLFLITRARAVAPIVRAFSPPTGPLKPTSPLRAEPARYRRPLLYWGPPILVDRGVRTGPMPTTETAMHEHSSPTHASRPQGSHDGTGAGDHDQPFGGFRPYQFNTRQLARLLLLRSELLDARLGYGRWAQDLAAGH